MWQTEESYADEERSRGEERRKPSPVWKTIENFADEERSRGDERRKPCFAHRRKLC